MLRIQIGDATAIPEEVFNKMLARFQIDKEAGRLPMIAAMTDPESGEATRFASIKGIGRMPDGAVYADLGVDICFNLENDTARIAYLMLREEQPQIENRLSNE